jgi:hypothetical protein
MSDVRDMTIRELAALANEVRSAPVGSRQLRRAADRMSMAAWALQGGALQQMIWWAGSDVAPEPPPDGRDDAPEPPLSGRLAKVLAFPLNEMTPKGEQGGF